VECRYDIFQFSLLHNLHLGPVLVQVLYICGPLLQTLLMRVSQALSKSYGRCWISAVFRWIGVVLMAMMIVSYLMDTVPTWITCTLFVFRTGKHRIEREREKSFFLMLHKLYIMTLW
jgi:hypothetical protein